MQIQDIYEELKENNMCKSAYAFSRNYLNKDPSYMSVLKARGKEPSIEALAVLSVVLQQRSLFLSQSDSESMRLAGKKLATLHSRVADSVVKACVEKIQ